MSLFEEEKNTEYFSLVLDNKVKRIEGDVKRILQMLNNLLTNAIDAVTAVKKTNNNHFNQIINQARWSICWAQRHG